MTPILQAHRPAVRPPRSEAWRRVVAQLLRAASAALARHAREVDRPLHARLRRASGDPLVEFHAEAGAPEGALYVEGRYVGTIDVRRL
jgi:hypothetical protein